ncbi:MAG: arsenate reductase ArsC [Candidatus Methanofastidiosa archaeon]|nr:arsenate reductase ArsC [Candidatus Methanofastidiosa archaeon]
MKVKVLFVCVHNSARSQMAEELLRLHGGDRFSVESAGYEPVEKVHPLVVEAMREKGVDLENKGTQSVFDAFKDGKAYDYVVTVCEECLQQGCPFFPYEKEFLRWSFIDPTKLEGSHEERLEGTRKVRDLIDEKILEFISYVPD